MTRGKGKAGAAPARRLALTVLNAVDQKGAYAGIELHKCLRSGGLTNRDRAFVTTLVNGTLRWRGLLDWWISQLSARALEDISIPVLNILRVSLYQIHFLDRVPSRAAVHEGVELAREFEKPGMGFVNAVLRSFLRKGKANGIPLPDPRKDRVSYIAVSQSHPEWLVRMWSRSFGYEETLALCRANNRKPRLTVRTNTLVCSRAWLRQRLISKGVKAELTSYAPEGLFLENVSGVDGLQEYRQGAFLIQSEASMLVGHVADPRPGQTVVDLCSAPGGKATHLAALMNDRGRVIAVDRYPHRVRLLEQTCQRLHIGSIETICADSAQVGADDTGCREGADLVVVDAPCTGLGTLARRPDLRWRKLPSDIDDLVRIQRSILNNAAAILRKGGYIVYSTCTISERENQENVAWFLNSHPGFQLTADFPGVISRAVSDRPGIYLPVSCIHLLPHRHGTDGFFIAKLQKKG